MKNNRTFLEKLLDGAEVEWKPLDEVANIVNNARKPVKSSLRVSGNIPYYGANNIQDYVEGYTHEGEFVLIAEDGSASLENYSIQWAVGKFWANNHVHVVNGKEKLNNRFLYHYLTNMNFIPFLAGKERAKLTKAKLQQIPIPIPPLSVQTEIVKILDALTASLPASLYYARSSMNTIEKNCWMGLRLNGYHWVMLPIMNNPLNTLLIQQCTMIIIQPQY